MTPDQEIAILESQARRLWYDADMERTRALVAEQRRERLLFQAAELGAIALAAAVCLLLRIWS